MTWACHFIITAPLIITHDSPTEENFNSSTTIKDFFFTFVHCSFTCTGERDREWPVSSRKMEEQWKKQHAMRSKYRYNVTRKMKNKCYALTGYIIRLSVFFYHPTQRLWGQETDVNQYILFLTRRPSLLWLWLVAKTYRPIIAYMVLDFRWKIYILVP